MVEQIADQVESFIFAINNRRDVAVELLLARATQLRRRDILTGYLADNLRASDIHFRLLIDGKDRKSTRLNSSHVAISYAVFCLKKKKGSPTRATHVHQHVPQGPCE